MKLVVFSRWRVIGPLVRSCIGRISFEDWLGNASNRAVTWPPLQRSVDVLLSSLSTPQAVITIFGVGLGGVAVGGLLLRDGLKWLNEALEKRHAPSVPGRIVSSRLAPRDLPADDGSYSRTWYLEVAYEYRVRGRPYRATQTMVFTGYLAATRQARRRETGAEVRVLFDRTEPDNAVLDEGLSVWHPWLYILAGASCVVGGVVALTRLSAAS